MRTVLRVLARPVLHEPYSCNKPIGAKSHRSSTSDNFSGAFEVLDQVLSRYLRTEIENLHGRFLLNLNFMQQCPVQSIVNSMARVERITNGVCSTPEYRIRGGRLSSLHCELLSPTCYCCISMPAAARANLSAKSCLALSCTSPWHSFTSFCFQKRGGERTGEDDLASDTSPSPLTVASEGGC
jgi:hypothetical protein